MDRRRIPAEDAAGVTRPTGPTSLDRGSVRAYVEGGGTLVVGPFSGVVDENDGIRAVG